MTDLGSLRDTSCSFSSSATTSNRDKNLRSAPAWGLVLVVVKTNNESGVVGVTKLDIQDFSPNKVKRKA